MRIVAVLVYCASFVFGQGQEKVLIASSPVSDLHWTEMATVIRSIGEIRELSVDTTARTMTVRGTAEQIGLAGWLFSELETAPVDVASPRERRMGSREEVVRLFPIAHAETPLALQEICTVVRSVLEARQAFLLTESRTLAMRGSAGQAAAAEWLLQKLDRPVSTAGDTQNDGEIFRLRSGGNSEEILRVFHLSKTSTVAGHNAATTHLRSSTGSRRMFPYMPTRAVAMRGTAEESRAVDLLRAER